MAVQTARPGIDGAVPTRHGSDLKTSRAMAARLRLLIRGNPEPDAAAWQTLGQALWRGDPLADDVVEWMHAEGMGRGWGALERAISHGDVPPQAPALERFISTVSRPPAWLDTETMARGARVLQSAGLHGMMVLRDAGLMAGYQASAINQTLVKTGALHKGAQRRVAETTAWWLACTRDGGMDAGGEGFKSTLRVRIVHAMVRRQLSQSPDWDAGQLGAPINQVDMQATYLAFSVVQLLSLKVTGVLVSRRDAAAVMHLWRYIGWLMGVEDGLMCHSEQEGRILLYRNVLSQAPPDESSVLLGRALMDEPLARHYPWGGAVRGRFNRARHLSLVRWFVGPQGLRHLGLPRVVPWYPLLMFAPLALRSCALRLLPGLQDPWRRWSRARQDNYLSVLMGPRQAPHQGGAGQRA